MKISQKHNLVYKGANNRSSLLDVIYPKSDAEIPIVLFAHGFKGFKDWGHFPLIADELAKAGFCVIKFNFSHNGGTVKEPIDFPDLQSFAVNSYWKELTDLSKLLEWIKHFDFKNELEQQVAKNEINLIGHSRGGGIAICAAAQFPAINKVVTWSAVADFVKRLPSESELKKWEKEGVRYIVNTRTKQKMPMNYSFVEELYNFQDKLSIENAVRNMTQPLLIIHGTNDEAVAVSAAKQLNNWNPQSELKLIEGSGHTYGGKHPWEEKDLPEHTKQLLDATIQFLKH
tara:strand:+ start:710 stop:1567 length:858 start_codon:yes stop_codon:yes gene_type:complete